MCRSGGVVVGVVAGIVVVVVVVLFMSAVMLPFAMTVLVLLLLMLPVALLLGVGSVGDVRAGCGCGVTGIDMSHMGIRRRHNGYASAYMLLVCVRGIVVITIAGVGVHAEMCVGGVVVVVVCCP